MRSLVARVPFTPVQLAGFLVGALAIVYVALIATVMSYAALTIGFAQSVKSDEAQVATLESQYLNTIATITSADYGALGYAKPVAVAFVAGSSATALR
jgi:hypothetical protein